MNSWIFLLAVQDHRPFARPSTYFLIPGTQPAAGGARGSPYRSEVRCDEVTLTDQEKVTEYNRRAMNGSSIPGEGKRFFHIRDARIFLWGRTIQFPEEGESQPENLLTNLYLSLARLFLLIALQYSG
jgi:hypothetical protein